MKFIYFCRIYKCNQQYGMINTCHTPSSHGVYISETVWYTHPYHTSKSHSDIHILISIIQLSLLLGRTVRFGQLLRDPIKKMLIEASHMVTNLPCPCAHEFLCTGPLFVLLCKNERPRRNSHLWTCQQRGLFDWHIYIVNTFLRQY